MVTIMRAKAVNSWHLCIIHAAEWNFRMISYEDHIQEAARRQSIVMGANKCSFRTVSYYKRDITESCLNDSAAQETRAVFFLMLPRVCEHTRHTHKWAYSAENKYLLH